MRARARPATAHLRLDEVSRGPDTTRRVRDGLAKRIVLSGEAVDYHDVNGPGSHIFAFDVADVIDR